MAGFLPAVAGDCSLGNNITIGYFDQYSAAIQSEKTVVEHFSDLFPSLTDKEVRTILGAYLFKGKDGAKLSLIHILLTLKAYKILQKADVIFCPEKKKGAGSFAFDIIKEHIKDSKARIEMCIRDRYQVAGQYAF